MKIIYTVWGIAAGRRTTKDAEPGAFTWRKYPTKEFPVKDWRHIIFIVEEREA